MFTCLRKLKGCFYCVFEDMLVLSNHRFNNFDISIKIFVQNKKNYRGNQEILYIIIPCQSAIKGDVQINLNFWFGRDPRQQFFLTKILHFFLSFFSKKRK